VLPLCSTPCQHQHIYITCMCMVSLIYNMYAYGVLAYSDMYAHVCIYIHLVPLPVQICMNVYVYTYTLPMPAHRDVHAWIWGGVVGNKNNARTDLEHFEAVSGLLARAEHVYIVSDCVPAYVYVCMCVCVCVCMYVCMQVCMSTNRWTGCKARADRGGWCSGLREYVCMYVHVCACMHACMYVYMYMYTWIVVDRLVYVCMYVCMYVASHR